VWHSPIKAAALSWQSSWAKERFATEVGDALMLAMDRVGRTTTVVGNEAYRGRQRSLCENGPGE